MGWFKKIAAAVGSLFGRRSRPAAAPCGPSPEEVAHLRGQLAEVERLRAEVERQRAEQTEATAAREAELQGREAELQRREEAAAREAEEQRRREEEARNYPLQEYQARSDWEGSVNIGLVGNSGVGKSLLSNAIRGARRGEAAWAPVGVSETTLEPSAHAFPGEPRARLWDLPGAGTARFPRDGYVRTVGLRHFDAVIVVSASRFTETELLLLAELRQYGVPHFAARTKIDVDIQNNEADNGLAPEATKRLIADDLRQRGVADPYLLNTRACHMHDFEKLGRDVHAAMVANRKY